MNFCILFKFSCILLFCKPLVKQRVVRLHDNPHEARLEHVIFGKEAI